MIHTSKPRSVRQFALISMLAAFACFLALFLFFFYQNMTDMLLSAEATHLNQIDDMVNNTVRASIEGLQSSTRAWSSWDDTYNYVLGKNDSYAADNLDGGTVIALYDVDFVIIKDLQGNDVYACAADPLDGRPQPEFPAALSERIAPISAAVLAEHVPLSLANIGLGPYNDTGFIVAGGLSYLSCTMPIVRSDDTGPAAGTLTFAVLCDNMQLKGLTGLQDADFAVQEGISSNVPINEPIFRSNSVSVISPVENLRSGRVTYLTISHPRTIFSEGMFIVNLTTATILLLLILVILIISYIFDRKLLRMLSSLTQDIRQVAGGESLNLEPYSKLYEFNELSGSVNEMLGRLDASAQLAEQSKISQMALENILNGMDAYLYVTDTDTDEILFINNKMREHFDIDIGQGKCCWEVLQDGFTERCAFCPCHKLSLDPDTPIVWEEFNTVTKRYYQNTDIYIDWIDGRKVHLQHSVDITERKLVQQKLERELAQQELMSQITESFIFRQDMEDMVHSAMDLVGNFMGLSRMQLLRLDREEDCFTCSDEWLAEGCGLAPRLGLSFHMTDDLRASLPHFNEDTLIRSGTADAARYVPPVFVELSHFLGIPLFAEGELYGFLSFGKGGPASGDWRSSDVALARLISSILSGVFSRNVLEQNMQMLSSIVENSPQCIAYLHADGRFRYVNPATMDIFGYTEEDFLTVGLPLLYDKEMLQKLATEIIPSALEQGSAVFELPMHCKDGTLLMMQASTFAMEDRTSLAVISTDLTELRQLEDQLISAVQQAEQSNKAKSEFLSRMSHEMRTPMNAIIGMVHIAQSSNDPVKKEYCLSKIDQASHHLLGVINDILDMSKIESGKFEISPDYFNLDHMISGVLSVINFRVDEKEQKLVLDLDPALTPNLYGDAQRLAQVLTNLLANAVKFTPEHGKITLSVHAEAEGDDDMRLTFTVRDTGIGISEDQQKNLFRSFEQADGTIARRFGGTGLGLAISQNIVQLMGGLITVTSRENEGSAFTFTINLIKDKKATQNAAKIVADLGKLRLLAVDDSRHICEYFSHVMEQMGICCDVASSATEALDFIHNTPHPYDMIFIDWMMPDMNGVELTQEIRKLETAQPVIIMISATEWNEIHVEANQAGVNGFIGKPLFQSALLSAIHDHLGTDKPELPIAADGETPDFSGKRALLAEDVDINREIVLTVLADTNLQIDCAVDGREAVNLFFANPDAYDIIFMDMHMPDVDGLEATRQIRNLPMPSARTVPIVAMTANVFREDVERCLAAGMNDHIGKPIDFEELFFKLRKFL